MKWIYNDGGRLTAGFRGKSNDCVCRSIAIITGLPYMEVYKYLANGNATQRRSKNAPKRGSKTASDGIYTTRKWFKDYMKELGFVWVPTMKVGEGCKVHLRENELPTGKLVVSVSKHFVAVVDGIIYDTHDCSREGNRCVYGYYLYTK
jgi:hypothetical protein